MLQSLAFEACHVSKAVARHACCPTYVLTCEPLPDTQAMLQAPQTDLVCCLCCNQGFPRAAYWKLGSKNEADAPVCREEADFAGNQPVPERPQFPPASVRMMPAFPSELSEHAGNILLVWTFVNTFADSLGTMLFASPAPSPNPPLLLSCRPLARAMHHDPHCKTPGCCTVQIQSHRGRGDQPVLQGSLLHPWMTSQLPSCQAASRCCWASSTWRCCACCSTTWRRAISCTRCCSAVHILIRHRGWAAVRLCSYPASYLP